MTDLLTFSVALGRVRQAWRAQASPGTTVGQVAAAVGRAAQRPAALIEWMRPLAYDDTLGESGLRAGDRVVILDGLNDVPWRELGGARELTLAWAGGVVQSGGRGQLSVGAGTSHDLDLGGQGGTLASLSFDPTTGGWGVTRTGAARVALDDLDVPVGARVPLNTQAGLLVWPQEGATPVRVALAQGGFSAGSIALPLGDAPLRVWVADESMALSLRGSPNVPVARMVGGVAAHLPPPAGATVQPFLLRLTNAQSRLSDLADRPLFYVR